MELDKKGNRKSERDETEGRQKGGGTREGRKGRSK